MPALPCFDCCRFVVSFDIGKCESSNFILLYQYCLGYSGSLVIPYEPEDRLLVLHTHTQKKAVGILIGIALN